MSYLLDTCVISELISKQPNQQVVNWIDGVSDDRVYLCVITIGEIKRGIEKLAESHRKQALQKWLKDDLLIRFDKRLLTIDLSVMLTWGALVARTERQGRKLPAIDSLIAAVAIQNELELVTRNEKDFEGAELTIVNPWV